MKINIRNEEAADFRRVEEIAREAFWNIYFPGATEHAMVHKMRQHPDFIEELAFVLEVNGKVEGAIFYTHTSIRTLKNEIVKTISFGPVFISPDIQKLGLGRKLISHSLEKAKEMGFNAVIILGYPHHYKSLGFKSSKNYRISHSDGRYYKGLLALALYENALAGCAGSVLFSKALEVSVKEVSEFDSTFAYKEKKFQKSQIEFEKACVALDE